jgi:threonine/homoserine/homoserine lactone efflux protein
MMLLSLLPFVIFAFATSVTPGPNNVMVFTAAARHGIRATVPLILGIALGLGIMVVVVGSGLAGPLATYQPLQAPVRWIGVGWMLLLAWQIARSGDPSMADRGPEARPLGAWGAMAFQWVNPKAWVMALATTATYVRPGGSYYGQVVTLAVVFTVVSIPSVSVWAVLGSRTRHLLASRARIRAFNIVMAILLACSTLPVLLEGR